MTKKTEKERIDKLLVQKNLVKSREKARAIIMAGQVLVNETRVDKAGAFIEKNADIRIKGVATPFVGRGGLKLDHAIEFFNVEVCGKTAIDVGASTGGFTDCLLQRGIGKVYAVDVGYGQIDLTIRQNPKVHVMDRTNIRNLDSDRFSKKIDLAVVDVSFISLTKVLPAIVNILSGRGEIIALIKPQFEVGKGAVGKGGIVKDFSKIEQVIKNVLDYGLSIGLKTIGTVESPVKGAKGNREFLVYMKNESSNQTPKDPSPL